jgi:hypothetical protein
MVTELIKQFPFFFMEPEGSLQCSHRSVPLVPLLSQINPIYNILPCFPKIHCNIILSSMHRFSEWSLPFFTHWHPVLSPINDWTPWPSFSTCNSWSDRPTCSPPTISLSFPTSWATIPPFLLPIGCGTLSHSYTPCLCLCPFSQCLSFHPENGANHHYPTTTLYSITTQETSTWIFTTIKTWNLKEL